MEMGGRFLLLLAVGMTFRPEQASGVSNRLSECDARVRAEPDSHASYICYYLAARLGNEWEEARRRLEALLARNARNDFARVALANIEADQGRDRAEDLYRVAARSFAARGQSIAEVFTRIGLATFLMKRGRLDDAETEASQATRIAGGLKNKPLVARAAVTEAWLAYRKESYGRAWALLNEVEAHIFPEGPADLRSTWLSAMGATCWATGRHEESFGIYRNQAALDRERGDLWAEATARVNMVLLGGILEMDRNEMADLAREALAVAIAGRNRSAEAHAQSQLAEATDRQEAIEHSRRAVDLSREVKDFSGTLVALRTLGNSLLEFDPDAAFRAIDEAIELARSHGNFSEIARNRVVWSRMRWKTGPRETAIVDSLAMLDAIEAMRDLQPDGLMRARRFGQFNHAYNTLVGHLFSEGPQGGAPSPEDLELAFSVMERRRSRSLLDELDAAQATPSIAAASPLQAQRATVLEGIVQVQRQLVNPALSTRQREVFIEELERLEIEEASLREQAARADPAFALLRRPTFPSLQEVRERLFQDEALLVFQIGRRVGNDDKTFLGGSWLFVITPTRTEVYSLPDSAELDLSSKLFHGLFERRDGSEGPGAARLYADLLGKALEDLGPGVRRLVILPDRELHHLPFGALRASPDGAPIAVRYEISIVPSAAIWLRWRRAGASRADIPALALADPAIPGSSQSGETVPAVSPERQWAFATATRLLPLRYARAEGRAAVRRLGGESRLLAGEEATEHFLKTADLKRFGVLHFAAHALMDDEHPERSAVLLAAGDEKDDGLLQIREVVNLRLGGGLVVLSACRSASGAVWVGEGVMGLARAFFQAGAHAVVGSLWPLRDEDAAAFFGAFYKHLSKGESVAAAHAGAQRERIQAGAPAAAWAGVLALGDGDLVPLPGGRRGFSWWYALLLAAVLAAAGTLVQRLRRRRA